MAKRRYAHIQAQENGAVPAKIKLCICIQPVFICGRLIGELCALHCVCAFAFTRMKHIIRRICAYILTRTNGAVCSRLALILPRLRTISYIWVNEEHFKIFKSYLLSLLFKSLFMAHIIPLREAWFILLAIPTPKIDLPSLFFSSIYATAFESAPADIACSLYDINS